MKSQSDFHEQLEDWKVKSLISEQRMSFQIQKLLPHFFKFIFELYCNF